MEELFLKNGASVPDTGMLYIQIIGDDFRLKRTATKEELVNMIEGMMCRDDVFCEAIYEVIDRMGYALPTPF